MHYKSHPSDIDRNNAFAVKVEDLIREIVIQNDIPYYRIESGVERHDQAEADDDRYMPVIRIITYFEDTVNKISHILHDEFDIDIERSVDKKKIRIETFAYKNINITARLTQNRQQQTEYKRSGDKKFEIQICSMLQDAWSGIEKELGYDNTVVPDEAKRDFYRVGALLEMADIEFLKIRTELGQRKKAAEAQPQAAPVAESPKAPVAEKSANTFVEHLHAVAKEVQKEVPAPQPEPVIAYTPPVQEMSKVVPPAPKVEYTPPAPPVYEAPRVAAPISAAPKPEPKVEYNPPAPPPVPEEPKVAASIPAAPEASRVAASAEPQPAVQKEEPVAQRPAAPAAGIAPKPTVIPQETAGIAAGANVNIESLKELAQSINKEPKPAAEIPQPVKEEPRPIVVQMPEPPKPTEPAAPVQPAVVSELSVTQNGDIEKAIEQSAEKSVPFYNEAARTAKAMQLDENAPMTDATLREYVLGSKLLKEIDQQIAERAGAKINTEVDIEGDVERLRFLKVYTLKQLHDRLTDNKNDIVAFAEKWIGKDNGGSFDSGISLFYLEYLLVGKKNDPAFAVEYVVKFISDNDYSARYIIPTYNSIHNTEAPNFSHLTLRA